MIFFYSLIDCMQKKRRDNEIFLGHFFFNQNNFKINYSGINIAL